MLIGISAQTHIPITFSHLSPPWQTHYFLGGLRYIILSRKRSKTSGGKILVNRSARLSAVGTYFGTITDLLRNILTHSCLVSMCFNFDLKHVSSAKTLAAVLSICNTAGFGKSIPISSTQFFRCISSTVALPAPYTSTALIDSSSNYSLFSKTSH